MDLAFSGTYKKYKEFIYYLPKENKLMIFQPFKIILINE